MAPITRLHHVWEVKETSMTKFPSQKMECRVCNNKSHFHSSAGSLLAASFVRGSGGSAKISLRQIKIKKPNWTQREIWPPVDQLLLIKCEPNWRCNFRLLNCHAVCWAQRRVRPSRSIAQTNLIYAFGDRARRETLNARRRNKRPRIDTNVNHF